MAKCTIIVILLLLTKCIAADDRIHFDEEDERRWNTPPELTPEAASATSENAPSPRFLPFSASFTLSSGSSNAHSLSVGGSNDGISLSQSQSSSSGGFGNADSGISASQSSSFTAGLSGISGSDANSFNLKHPVFGGHSQADSNSFALGQASASSHSGVFNNIASTGAQSSIGNSYSSTASGSPSIVDNYGGFNVNSANRDHRRKPYWTNIAPNYDAGGVYNPSTGLPALPVLNRPQTRPLRLNVGIDDSRLFSQRPEVLISDYQPPTRHYRQFQQVPNTQMSFPDKRDQWSQDHLTGPAPQEWSQNNQHPVQIAVASAMSSASSNSPNSFSFGQSSSHGQSGLGRPSTWSTNHAESSGNAQSHAQGSAAAVGQISGGKAQASSSSGVIFASSMGNGHSQGTSLSGNRGNNSRGQVNSQSFGTSFAQGTANAGSVSIFKFPGDDNNENVPREFFRNKPSNMEFSGRKRGKINRTHPIDEILTEITDSVSDLFEF